MLGITAVHEMLRENARATYARVNPSLEKLNSFLYPDAMQCDAEELRRFWRRSERHFLHSRWCISLT
jgi:hypothetical protein